MIDVLGLGIGPPHISPDAHALLARAHIVGGGRTLLARLKIPAHKRLELGRVESFVAALRNFPQDTPICILADGDPLLFGLGATLRRFFTAEEMRMHPHISAVQTLAARCALPWHDCTILSLHGRTNTRPLFAALTHDALIAVYTDTRFTPAILAGLLCTRQVKGWRMHVGERLGFPDEQLSTGRPEDFLQLSTQNPNLVLLERVQTAQLPLRLGLPDELLARQDALVTKAFMRAYVLSLLSLDTASLFWDLGAGSGAVSLEAASILRTGSVCAVEERPLRVADITQNILRTGAWLVEPICTSIEAFLKGPHLQRPTHIFFGGGASAENLRAAWELLQPGGRLVLTAVLLSTLETARSALAPYAPRVEQLLHASAKPLGHDVRLVPSNPVFSLCVCKPAE